MTAQRLAVAFLLWRLAGQALIFPASWPGLTRTSRLNAATAGAWMAGSSPAMTAQRLAVVFLLWRLAGWVRNFPHPAPHAKYRNIPSALAPIANVAARTANCGAGSAIWRTIPAAREALIAAPCMQEHNMRWVSRSPRSSPSRTLRRPAARNEESLKAIVSGDSSTRSDPHSERGINSSW